MISRLRRLGEDERKAVSVKFRTCGARDPYGQSIDTAGPGELLGEMAMIDGHERSATAVALNPCQVAVVTERQFLFMVHETPNFG
jgi:CRP-like cAMP-binding protein